MLRLHPWRVLAGALLMLSLCLDGAAQPEEMPGLPNGQNGQRPMPGLGLPPGAAVHLHSTKPTHVGLRYAEASKTQQLDLYLPAAHGGPSPVIVFFHGGGFRFGDRTEPIPDFSPYLKAGYAVASVDYRLSGEAHFPAAVQDGAAAVRWLRAHAPAYGLDPSRFAVWGQSAGANIAAILGTATKGQFDDAALGNGGVSSKVKVAIAQYAPIDFLQLDKLLAGCKGPMMGPPHDSPQSFESSYLGAPIQTVPKLAQAANPITYIDGSGADFLIQGGGHDCAVGVEQSRLLYKALLPVVGEHRVELDVLPEAAHADPAFETPANTARVLKFLAAHF